MFSTANRCLLMERSKFEVSLRGQVDASKRDFTKYFRRTANEYLSGQPISMTARGACTLKQRVLLVTYIHSTCMGKASSPRVVALGLASLLSSTA